MSLCLICFESEEESGIQTAPLEPCGHEYHLSCVKEYAFSQGILARCPTCRAEVTNVESPPLELRQAKSEERSQFNFVQSGQHLWQDELDEIQSELDQLAAERETNSLDELVKMRAFKAHVLLTRLTMRQLGYYDYLPYFDIILMKHAERKYDVARRLYVIFHCEKDGLNVAIAGTLRKISDALEKKVSIEEIKELSFLLYSMCWRFGCLSQYKVLIDTLFKFESKDILEILYHRPEYLKVPEKKSTLNPKAKPFCPGSISEFVGE